MCLSVIDVSYDKPSDLIVDGWKEFSGPSGSPMFLNYTTIAVPLDQWLEASKVKNPQDINMTNGKTYRAGFHAFSDEKEIDVKSRFRRVYLRRITCAGAQDGKKCVVAQEMYVPSGPNVWPPKPTPIPGPPPKKKLMDRIKKAKFSGSGRKS